MDERSVRGLVTLLKTCQKERGILVASPEYILSFNLMALDYSCRVLRSVSKPLNEAQTWLESTVRDILDESDEILSVKYQLVYTIGNQQAMDGHPDRWIVIQQLLGLLRRYIDEASRSCVTGFEIHPELGACFSLSFASFRSLKDSMKVP